MKWTAAEKEWFAESNRREYGSAYDFFSFPSPQELAQTRHERDRLLAALQTAGAHLAANGTKIHTAHLSPGCRHCTAGVWSCLFINTICNGRCFYCPAPQNEDGPPATNAVEFPSATSYAEYVARFRFGGASISGGEPFLTFDRTLEYLAAVRRRLGPAVHLWLYTNGRLSTPAKLRRLAAAGLNEIRFDIGATGYHLDKVRQAIDIIPTVTVEIPAIPGHLDRLKRTAAEMARLGAHHLNLHQLRVTPHNSRHIIARGYTLLQGPRLTVLASENTALRLMDHTLRENIPLPVNYCSFLYKDTFQTVASRRRHAATLCRLWEDITPTGLIRSLNIRGEPAVLEGLAGVLRRHSVPTDQWQLDPAEKRLNLRAAHLPLLPAGSWPLLLTYHLAAIRPTRSGDFPHQEIRFDDGRRLYVQRRPVMAEKMLRGADIPLFSRHFASPADTAADRCPTGDFPADLFDGTDSDGKWLEICRAEILRPGFQEYF